MTNYRIAVVGASPCGQCTAVCCKQTLTEYAALLEGAEEERRFRSWSKSVVLRDGDEHHTRRVIPYRDGRCAFLGGDDRCTIYEDRPLHCGRFECTKFHYSRSDYGEFLRTNMVVVSLLQPCT